MDSHEPAGHDVDENAIRFSNYFHVLRELVHLSCGWLPIEPRLEVKYALGDHLHDDARTLTKIRRRLYELRTPSDYPGAPDAELAALLDRAAAHTDCVHPRAPQGGGRPARPGGAPSAALGARPIRRSEPPPRGIFPPLDEPARDAFVKVTPEGDTFLSDELYINGEENHVP